LARVLERHPDHRGAHAALADYYDRIGQPARAAEHRQRAGDER
jgi:Tfp pilus assembly protein PilF